MGGSPYWYIVPHEKDVKAALRKLRQREFKAGRYNPVIPMPRFPITAKSPAPGAKHRTIAAALKATEPDGTRSILDIKRISSEPKLYCATLLDKAAMKKYFGTIKPKAAVVEQSTTRNTGRADFFTDIERGKAIYFELFENGTPTEFFFAGYSFD